MKLLLGSNMAKPNYPDARSDDSFEQGLKYQDFIRWQLQVQRGISLSQNRLWDERTGKVCSVTITANSYRTGRAWGCTAILGQDFRAGVAGQELAD
jgi:hypothetical protein